jgi:hypothetical protein
VPPNQYSTLFNSPILTQYIVAKHGQAALDQFRARVANM